MKILFLGDFSSLYNNLQDGLRELGHEAVIASSGDSWKCIQRDINLGSSGRGFLSKVSRKLFPMVKLKKLSGYDVVQYINPFYIYHKLMPNRLIIERIINGNGKFFLSAAGDDAYFWRFARKNMRYGIFDDFLRYDIKKDRYFMQEDGSFRFNDWLANRVDGIIPIMVEYADIS